jgi:hypothetical protein
MKTMKHFLTTLSIVLGLVLPLNIYMRRGIILLL